MRLVPTDKSDLKFRQTKILKLIENFQRMDVECCELVGAKEHYCSPLSGAGTINRALKRYRIGGIRASVKGDKVFLIKVEV